MMILIGHDLKEVLRLSTLDHLLTTQLETVRTCFVHCVSPFYFNQDIAKLNTTSRS